MKKGNKISINARRRLRDSSVTVWLDSLQSEFSSPNTDHPGNISKMTKSLGERSFALSYNPRILIIDDQAANLRIMQKLSLVLYPKAEVLIFTNPVKALESIRQSTPDLILSDYEMPEMDGAAFVSAIRNLPDCTDIPIVVVTIYEDLQLRYNALKAGATDFLLSPLDYQEFSIRLHNLLLLQQHQRTIKNHAKSLGRKLIDDSHTFSVGIKELEGRLVQLLDAIPALVSVSDADHGLRYVNHEWCAFHGLNKEQAAGKKPDVLFPAEHGALLRKAEQSVLSSGSVMDLVEDGVVNADGQRKVLFTKKMPLVDVAGQVTGVITVSVDMTSRKLAEEQLASSIWRAEASERAKEAFFSQMSHELRTPLNAILGFSQVMLDELFGPLKPERYRNYALDINVSAERLLVMVQDIMAHPAITADPPPEPSSDVVALVAAASNAAQTIHERYGPRVRIFYDIATNTPALKGDRRMIERILIDVIDHLVSQDSVSGEFVVSVAATDNGPLNLHITGGAKSADDVASPISMELDLPGLPLAAALVSLHGGSLTMRRRTDGILYAIIGFPVWRTLGPQTP